MNVGHLFSPGKKKTQEGKKGKKAADTKQKKADLDSTAADMRDSKEGEFLILIVVFILLTIFLNRGRFLSFLTC